VAPADRFHAGSLGEADRPVGLLTSHDVWLLHRSLVLKPLE
jgi:hypothetical protein